MANSIKFPQKLKIELLYDPAIPLLYVYPEEMNTGYVKDICTPMFLSALFTMAKPWKQRVCQMNKDMVYTIYMCVCA